MPKLYIKDFHDYYAGAAENPFKIGSQKVMRVFLDPDYSGWTLAVFNSEKFTISDITINILSGDVLHIISQDFNSRPFRAYKLADGTLIADLGEYLPSMLAHRAFDSEEVNGLVRFLSVTWAYAFECFKYFSPEKITVTEAQKLNKKRPKKVTPATTNDYILKLTPEKIQYIREKQKQEAEEHEKRTLRYHMARGHYRHYKNGKTVWIKAHYKGDKAKGIINKDYQLTTL